MSDDQVTIIPNMNPALCRATLLDSGKPGESWDLHYQPIIAWAIRTDRDKVNGDRIYSVDAIDCDEGGHDDAEGYAVFDKSTQDWHMAYVASGNGKDSLIELLSESAPKTEA